MDIKQIRLNNLRSLIAEAGTIAKLARLSETAPAYLSQILNSLPTSTGKPRSVGDKLARKLEQALDKPYGWMDKDHNEAEASLSPAVPLIPLLSGPEEFQKQPLPPYTSSETLPLPITASDQAFAIRIWDDSMSPRFHSGDVIIIDPCVPPQDNDFVLARTGSGEIVVRQLVEENGQALKDMNAPYTSHAMRNEDSIMGKVIYRAETL